MAATHPAGTAYLDQANAALDEYVRIAGDELAISRSDEVAVMVVSAFAATQPEAAAAAGLAAVRINRLNAEIEQKREIISVCCNESRILREQIRALGGIA